jgi:hypothetical protein
MMPMPMLIGRLGLHARHDDAAARCPHTITVASLMWRSIHVAQAEEDLDLDTEEEVELIKNKQAQAQAQAGAMAKGQGQARDGDGALPMFLHGVRALLHGAFPADKRGLLERYTVAYGGYVLGIPSLSPSHGHGPQAGWRLT